MPWIVGIDEAGYGPNLGPLVMTAVACRVPEPLAGADLWHVLRPAVRRHGEPDDGRLLVEDSKVVYSAARGLFHLEIGALATLRAAAAPAGDPPLTLAGLIDGLCPDHHEQLLGEPWYSGASALPLVVEAPAFAAAVGRLQEACQAGAVAWGAVRSVVVCPPQFNALLDQWGSKGALLGHGLAELLRGGHDPDGGTEPVYFFIDKHGGRNHYAPMLQQALPEGMVMAHEQGMERSVYSVFGLRREVRLTFRPRADAEFFCVALASMVSKYLREVFMHEFNHFWQGHLPGLKPTAGYPGDAARFFTEIRPVAERLGIPEHALWRRR